MSGEELTAALRKSQLSRRRQPGFLDKQQSCESQEHDLVSEQSALERVRFDDNVSFIEASSPETESEPRIRADMTYKVTQQQKRGL